MLISLASCGGKGPATNIYTYATIEEMRADLDRQTVHCASTSDCPGYVAKLAMWERDGYDYNLGTCSGSLYNNKYIITNSHCIPYSLNTGASCLDQIKVLFPSTNQYYQEEARCQRVIQVHRNGGPDIAVIELDRVVHRTSVEIEANAFYEDADVYAHTVNPMSRTVGIVYKKTCKLSLDNAITFGTSRYADKAVIHGYSCNVIGGNSGSALMKDGKLIAAIFARLKEDAAFRFTKAGINFQASQPTGVVQNIGCIASITSNSGYSCTEKLPSASDVEGLIKRAKDKQGFSSASESNLEYKIIDGVKLELTSVSTPSLSKSLDSFRKNWINSFRSSAHANSLENFIVK